MKRTIYILLLTIILSASCTTTIPPTGTAVATGTPISPTGIAVATDTPVPPSTPIYTQPSQSIEARVEDLLSRMSLDEKIGQMVQVEKDSIRRGDITKYFIGSILSGGGGSPANNSPEGWGRMVDGFQQEAMATPLAIPLIYGVDATHGHGNLKNATIFPQEIGLGAARNPQLAEQIGQATAEEMLATGIPWTFSPIVAVPQDIRWGRTYESFSENTELVSELAVAYLKGLQTLPEGYQAAPEQTLFTLATAKHFLGDGGTIWGSSRQNIMNAQYMLDQGNMQADEATVRALYLPPYQAAVDAGAMSIMASFSSWRGTKMHAQKYLLTNVLKDELGFQGFIVSDWGGIDQIYPDDYYESVVTSINAGVDMNMVPYDYIRFITAMKNAVEDGDITQERINDAVRRILRVKFALGLFDHPYSDPAYLAVVRSQKHLNLARQAVRESLVLLKNDNAALPIAKDTPTIFVAGRGADNIGVQCGGWTIQWQGESGMITAGTTILSAIKAAVSPETSVQFNTAGRFEGRAEIGIVVVGEMPYAEGVGDRADLSLTSIDPAGVEAIDNMRPLVDKLIVIILSGRPLVITDQYQIADGWVAAWLPGSEGAGVADVLFGDYPFTGELPYTWPRSNAQLPLNINNVGDKQGCEGPLFPYGYGLGEAGSQPIEWVDCP